MRDPSRAPLDVVVRNLSTTGALLEAEGELPVGTLVSLGIAGAGMQFARVVREAPGGVAIEFMLPLDARAVAAAGRVDTLVSVAFPQMTACPSVTPTISVDSRVAPPAGPPAAPETAAPSRSSATLVWALLAVAVLATLLYLWR